MAMLLVCITLVVSIDEQSTFELKHFLFFVAYTMQLAKCLNLTRDFSLIIQSNAGSFSSHNCAHTAKAMCKLQLFQLVTNVTLMTTISGIFDWLF